MPTLEPRAGSWWQARQAVACRSSRRLRASGGHPLRPSVPWSRAAGIDGQISPHSLRHTFATIALDAGTTLHDLQDSMGHADPRTTRRYDRARHTLEKAAGYDVAPALS